MRSDEVETILKDKSDFQKRLKLIADLKERSDEHSIKALQHLAKNDFVYQVRLDAWQTLSQKGITCVKPVARPRYAVLMEKFIQKLRRLGMWLFDLTEGFR